MDDKKVMLQKLTLTLKIIEEKIQDAINDRSKKLPKDHYATGHLIDLQWNYSVCIVCRACGVKGYKDRPFSELSEDKGIIARPFLW